MPSNTQICDQNLVSATDFVGGWAASEQTWLPGSLARRLEASHSQLVELLVACADALEDGLESEHEMEAEHSIHDRQLVARARAARAAAMEIK